MFLNYKHNTQITTKQKAHTNKMYSFVFTFLCMIEYIYSFLSLWAVCNATLEFSQNDFMICFYKNPSKAFINLNIH